MKEEKRHVGRPTNEEVKERRKKQLLKVLMPIIIAIVIIIVLSINVVPQLLKGVINTTGCNDGQIKVNGNCIDTIAKCKSGYAPISGTCKKVSKFISGKKCPNDFKICINQNKCNCYNVRRHDGIATACISGYDLIEGYCISTSDGWKDVNSKRYYYKNGEKLIWAQQINGKTYYFNSSGQMQTGFIRYNSDKKYRYFSKDGSQVFNRAIKINNNKYYCDKDGICKKGTNTRIVKSLNSSKESTTKVLLIGNSYTYYMGYGQMITKLAKKTGKKLIVVRATKGSTFADGLAVEKLEWCKFDSTSNDVDNSKCGRNYLKNIIKEDFGVKANYWDYVILQNNEPNLGKVVSGDNRIYNMFNNITVKNFVINSPHFRTSIQDAENKLRQHEIFVKSKKSAGNVSIIKSVKLFEKYGNWQNDLVFHDKKNKYYVYHMNGKGAYLYALATYAKIYGVSQFASNADDSNFIPLYNSNNGTTKEFAPNRYNEQCNNNAEKCRVTITTAKKFQALVRNNCSIVGVCK